MFGVALLSTFIALAGARIYERCELARDLLKLGVNKDHVATWVCIAFHESLFDTAARNPHSGDHGLLQISELYWCGPGKACGVPCSAFRDDDISDDVQCALRIYEEHTRLQGNGFLAWVVYPHHCKQNAKKYLVDCDSFTKNSVANVDDRARYLKTFEMNVTIPKLTTYQQTDRVKPTYLAINELFKETYGNEFEKMYYNDKDSFNWLNFKISNIDELKLPNLAKKSNFIFTTPPTTTTTVDPTLIGIKPPSPRKIESNQFRRRMMNLDTISRKDEDNYNFLHRKLKVERHQTTTPHEEYIDLSHNPFINLKTMTPEPFKPTTYRPRGLSNYSPNYISSFTTTSRPITTTRSTSSDKKVSILKNNINTYPTSANLNTSRRGKSRYVPELSDFIGYTRTQRPTTSVTQTQVKNNTRANINKNVSVNNSSVNDENKIKLPELTTLRNNNSLYSSSYGEKSTVSTILVESASTLSENSSDIEQKYATTSSPLTTTIKSSKTTSTLKFNWDRFHYIQSTTSRPQTNWTTTSRIPRTTITSTTTTKKVSAVPVSTSTTTTKMLSTEATPTIRTTQSIFDLYLNPTKATLRPFIFSSFKNSPFKLRIFSGGTTTSSPHYSVKNHN